MDGVVKGARARTKPKPSSVLGIVLDTLLPTSRRRGGGAGAPIARGEHRFVDFSHLVPALTTVAGAAGAADAVPVPAALEARVAGAPVPPAVLALLAIRVRRTLSTRPTCGTLSSVEGHRLSEPLGQRCGLPVCEGNRAAG